MHYKGRVINYGEGVYNTVSVCVWGGGEGSEVIPKKKKKKGGGGSFRHAEGRHNKFRGSFKTTA